MLYDNHNAIKNKEVIVELNNEQIVTKTNHQGKINLSSKSDTQFYHMGSPLIYDLPNQKIRILVPGYNPVKFEFFKYLPEKSTRIKGEYISENNGIINLGKLELNKEIN